MYFLEAAVFLTFGLAEIFELTCLRRYYEIKDMHGLVFTGILLTQDTLILIGLLKEWII